MARLVIADTITALAIYLGIGAALGLYAWQFWL